MAREQIFDYGNYYFRVAQLPPRWTLDRFYSLVRSDARFSVADRTSRGTAYASCVSWAARRWTGCWCRTTRSIRR